MAAGTPGDRRYGGNTIIEFTPDGGSALTLSGDFTSFSLSRSVDTADATAGNERTRYPIPTIEGMEGSIDIFDADWSTDEPDLLPGTVGVFEVWRDGKGVGKDDFSFTAVITSFDVTTPFDDLVTISISFVRQGDMVAEMGSVQSA